MLLNYKEKYCKYSSSNSTNDIFYRKYCKYSSSNSTSSKDYYSLYIKYKIKYLNLKKSNMDIIKQNKTS